MLRADRDGHGVVAVGADTLDICKRGAGDDEAAVFHLRALELLAALRKAVSVNGDKRERVILDLEQRAGVYRADVTVGDSKDGLVYHALEYLLREGDVVQAVYRGHLGVVVGADAHEVEFALAALDVYVIVRVRADGDYAVRQSADHLAEEARADDDAALLGDVGRDICVYALFQVVARDAQVDPCLKQQPLKRRNRAFGSSCSGGDGAGGLKNIFFA